MQAILANFLPFQVQQWHVGRTAQATALHHTSAHQAYPKPPLWSRYRGQLRVPLLSLEECHVLSLRSRLHKEYINTNAVLVISNTTKILTVKRCVSKYMHPTANNYLKLFLYWNDCRVLARRNPATTPQPPEAPRAAKATAQSLQWRREPAKIAHDS